MGLGHTPSLEFIPPMFIRTTAISVAFVCLTALLWVAQSPPLALGVGHEFSLMGLAGIGLMTLRSEAHRLGSQGRLNDGARRQAGPLADR